MKSPPIVGWARPLDQGDLAALTFHGVEVIAASVETACGGRWPACERREFLDGRDRVVDSLGQPMNKCGACDRVARIQRTEDGLAELAAEGDT